MRIKNILASAMGALSGAALALALTATAQTVRADHQECELAPLPLVATLVGHGGPAAFLDHVRQAH